MVGIKFIQRISAPVWCLSMLLPLFLAGIFHGIVHPCMRALAALVVELWYLSSFESFSEVAADYYRASKLRFRTSFFLMICLTLFSMAFDILHIFAFLPENVIGIIASVLFFVSSLVFVWQLVILMNVSTFTLADDEFRNERVKWLLAYLFAPIGVFWVMPKIKSLK